MIKTNQQLAKVSQEEERSLQTKLRGSAAVTPLETKVIGGNTDQAKMAGTGQQKQGVLNKAVKGSSSLQTSLRQQQDRTQATEEEATKSSAAGRLQNLSGLQDRVQTAAQGILNANAPETNIGQAAISGDPELDSLLNLFQTDPTNMDTLLQINNRLGNTNVGSELTAAQISERFNLDLAAAGESFAETAQDDVFVGDLDLASMGDLSSDELATLLGIPMEALSALTISELRAEINSQIEEEFNSVQNLERTVLDINAGPAERAEARLQLRDMGAVGVRSVESDMDSLADSIESAETVNFMGEDIAIQDLLDDSFLSGVAASYLNPDTNAEWLNNFKAENPEMAAWLDSNKNALSEAVQNIDTGTQAFAQIQSTNQALATGADGLPLSTGIMQALVPGWGTLQSTEFDKTQMPIFKILNDPLKKNQAQNLTAALRDLDKFNPEMVQQLAGMTEDQLGKLGILSNTTGWKTYTNYLKDQQAISQIDPLDSDSIYKTLFGPSATAKSHQGMIGNFVAKLNSGLFNIPLDPALKGLLGTKVVNGKPVYTLPKNPQELQAAIRGFMGAGLSPQDLLNGKTANGFSTTANVIQKPEMSALSNPAMSEIYEALKPYYMSGNTELTAASISQVIRTPANLELVINNLPLAPKEKQILTDNLVSRYRFSDVETLLTDLKLGPVPSELASGLSGEYNPANFIESLKLSPPGTPGWKGFRGFFAQGDEVLKTMTKTKESIAQLRNSLPTITSPLKRRAMEVYADQLTDINRRLDAEYQSHIELLTIIKRSGKF